MERFDLWELPTGMYFFEPRLEGDGEFYSTFYKHINMPKRLRVRGKGWRREFDMASERVRPGDRVLDVGCGFASFRTVVPQANYTGLDPNFREHDPLGQIRTKASKIISSKHPNCTTSCARSRWWNILLTPWAFSGIW